MPDRIVPAIVAVAYNRPDALSRLLGSLSNARYPAENIPLVISIDKGDNQAAVRAVAEAFSWAHGEKHIRCFASRQGLRSHVLQCGDLSGEYGAVILLEDDLIVSPGYYDYIYQAAAYYRDDPEICGYALYSHAWNGYADYSFLPEHNGYDTYLGQYSITWGQCWTGSQWRGFRNWYAAHEDADLSPLYPAAPADVSRWPASSWGKYFVYYITSRDLYYVIPYVSLSTNCEEAGQHAAGGDDSHQVSLLACDTMPYRFAPVDRAVRYDMFFERSSMELPPIAGIPIKDICMDLNGTKSSTLGKRYILTQNRYSLPELAAFGLRLRPVEANLRAATPGRHFLLYDAKEGLPPPVSREEYQRLRYETYRIGWRRLLKYAFRTFLQKLFGRIRRTLGRS